MVLPEKAAVSAVIPSKYFYSYNVRNLMGLPSAVFAVPGFVSIDSVR